MTRTIYILTRRWWYLFCTTRWIRLP